MTALIVAIVQVVASLGFGALVLRALGLAGQGPARERLVYAFALGMGVIGWIVFFVGVGGSLNDTALAVILGVGVIAAIAMRSVFSQDLEIPTGLVAAILLLLMTVTGLMDLAEAFTPTGDADTLAYHFALPKQFLSAGRIEFVPRAVDTAMLTHMTYIPVLGLGGEAALLLWAFASGWVAVYAVYILARRHLDLNWSLAVALAFATTPAVVFGAGSGHVEVRNLVFVVAAVLAVTADNGRKGVAFSIITGLLAGFFAGSKYFGLLFAAACGLAVLWEKRRLRPAVAYGLAVLFAGSQWYVWNAVHIGDPVFPALFEWLGEAGTPYWSDEHQHFFRTIYAKSFVSVPTDIFWFLAYPFKATLDGGRAFESARIGFGPVIWLALPFALAGAWKYRAMIRPGALLTYAFVALIFYSLWFFSGSSQKVRYLLPVYPLLLVPVMVAAQRFAGSSHAAGPLVAAVAFAVIVQLGGHGLYSLKSVRYVFGDESRQQFLLRTVTDYQPAPWINANLGPDDKLLMRYRNYLYYLDVPYYYAHPAIQAMVNLSPGAADPGAFVDQLRRLGITHLLLPRHTGGSPSSLWRLSKMVEKAGCLVRIKSFSTRSFTSRTLPTLSARRSAASFKTGRAPGQPRQTGQVFLFGSAPKFVGHPQKSLERVAS